MLQRLIVMVWMVLTMAACASLPKGFEAPVISLQGFQAVSSDGVAPDFLIRVKILNPNQAPLPLQGMYYSVELEGERLLAGVKSDLPSVAGYGEEVVEIRAGVDWLGGIRLVNDLIQRPRSDFDYSLQLKLDVEGLRRPLRLEQDGKINLNNSARGR